MATLTLTALGQVTFQQDVLQHLGIQPGDKIHLRLLPDGRAELRAGQPKGSIRDLKGFLRNKTNGRQLTLDEIEEAIVESAAQAGSDRM